MSCDCSDEQHCLLILGGTTHVIWCRYDLDFITLISDLNLGSVKMYQYTEHEVCRSRCSRFIAQRVATDTLFLLA